MTGDYALVTGKNVMEVYDLREGASKCKLVKEKLLVETFNAFTLGPESWDLSRSRRNPMLSYGVWHPKREDICLATASESKSVGYYYINSKRNY